MGEHEGVWGAGGGQWVQTKLLFTIAACVFYRRSLSYLSSCSVYTVQCRGVWDQLLGGHIWFLVERKAN